MSARSTGADAALFPEMWSIGMTFYDPMQPAEAAEWLRQAISQDDPFIDHFRHLAGKLDMAIALTYVEKCNGKHRTFVSLIDRRSSPVHRWSD